MTPSPKKAWMVMVSALLSPYNTFYLTNRDILPVQCCQAYFKYRLNYKPDLRTIKPARENGHTETEGEEKEPIFPVTSLSIFVWPFSRSLFLLLAIIDLRGYLMAYIQYTYLVSLLLTE